MTHSPHFARPPGSTAACAPAPMSRESTPISLPSGVSTVRVGTTTRTSVGAGMPANEMQAVKPLAAAKPAGLPGSAQRAQSASVVPKFSAAYRLAASTAAAGLATPLRYNALAAASAAESAAFCAWRRVSRASPRSTTSAATPNRTRLSPATSTATAPLSSRLRGARRFTRTRTSSLPREARRCR